MSNLTQSSSCFHPRHWLVHRKDVPHFVYLSGLKTTMCPFNSLNSNLGNTKSFAISGMYHDKPESGLRQV